MADEEFERAKAELGAALDARLAPLAGIAENTAEARALLAVLLGARPPAGNQKTIAQQVAEAQIDEVNRLPQVMTDVSNRLAVLINWATQTTQRLDALAADVAAIEAALAGDGK